ncbi:aromatic ring-hydroxylating oxygenase subunit alpha [Streptomyces sp. NBC_00258]|uniref:aromatic ring-hydroxylating oxygenase subunit alpha n=1 Tax=Streptomyces sp. NBC_00258 TaxID=2903642 RepID=UPI002E27BA0E|nr:aromatic ring-hydroxylating dioxygenase subunit alpha [Streptomyces sp. NBC_00258]
MSVTTGQPATTRHGNSYFTSLPREWYTSPEIFRKEIDKIFHRQWIYVGHVSQAKNTGDYFVARAATESIIVTRAKNGGLRAHFNVCRHRGSQLCDELSSGNTKRFVCPYHNWTYDLDGKLAGAPATRDGVDFNYSEFGLQDAYVDTFHGSIYVWLGREQPACTLREQLTGGGQFPIDDARIEIAEPERLKLAHEVRYEIKANWKLMIENNIECYHCISGHPSLMVSCDATNYFYERDEEGGLKIKGDGSYGLRPDMKTFSMDGELVSKKQLGALEPGDSIVWVDNLMWNGTCFFTDHSQRGIVNPLTVDTCELWMQWFVHENAVEGVDYEVGPLTQVFKEVAAEDHAFVERNARGVKSSRYVPGPNNALRETDMEAALTMYLNMMET